MSLSTLPHRQVAPCTRFASPWAASSLQPFHRPVVRPDSEKPPGARLASEPASSRPVTPVTARCYHNATAETAAKPPGNMRLVKVDHACCLKATLSTTGNHEHWCRLGWRRFDGHPDSAAGPIRFLRPTRRRSAPAELHSRPAPRSVLGGHLHFATGQPNGQARIRLLYGFPPKRFFPATGFFAVRRIVPKKGAGL